MVATSEGSSFSPPHPHPFILGNQAGTITNVGKEYSWNCIALLNPCTAALDVTLISLFFLLGDHPLHMLLH